jgi:hypothetical protein
MGAKGTLRMPLHRAMPERAVLRSSADDIRYSVSNVLLRLSFACAEAACGSATG